MSGWRCGGHGREMPRQPEPRSTVHLRSWNEGTAKAAITSFVRSVTEPGEFFVPPADRIATFDNDGTLWCEKPTYPQADLLLRRWAEQVKADPAKAKQQPWKAVTEGDRAWFAAALDHVPDLIRGASEAYDGISTEAFESAVRGFFDSAEHPTLGVPYTAIGYRPMRELIEMLDAHDFAVYICSGGGRDFVRVVAQEMYGIPRERVIGSGSTLEYRAGDVYRTRGVEQPIDDGPRQPVDILTRTGGEPLFAGGKSHGDTPVLGGPPGGVLI